MKILIKLKKSISIVTVVSLLISFVIGPTAVNAMTSEEATAKYKQIFKDFMLPYNYGQITDAHYAGTDRVIINIQDLHCHPQVQRNISNIIETFDKSYGVKKVYLEGAYGKVDTNWINRKMQEYSMPGLLDKMLDTGRLTGAEYYSALSGKNQIINGLEEKGPYLNNLKRFGEIVENQEKINLILQAADESLAKVKQQYYTKRQYKLEELSNNYREGKISSQKYYALLSKHIDKLGIDISKYENIFAYIMLLELQKKLDYSKITGELQSLVFFLRENLPNAAYQMLVDNTENFSKMDKLYGYIVRISRQLNLDLTINFPNLDNYFGYIEFSQKINPLGLIAEEKLLSQEINTRFSETKAQREVVFLTNFARYIKDYVSSKITSQDYEYYKENIDTYRKLWNKYVDNRVLSLLDEYIVEADKFYKINTDRNIYFTNNMFKESDELNKIKNETEAKDDINKIIENMKEVKEVDVVITGGFHSQTVTKILKNHGVSYIVITPNVTGGTKLAEETYYEIAKEQSKMSFQTLANLIASLSPIAQQKILESIDVKKTNEQISNLSAEEKTKKLREIISAKLLESDDEGEVIDKIVEEINRYSKEPVTEDFLNKINVEKFKEVLDGETDKIQHIINVLEENNIKQAFALLQNTISEYKFYIENLMKIKEEETVLNREKMQETANRNEHLNAIKELKQQGYIGGEDLEIIYAFMEITKNNIYMPYEKALEQIPEKYKNKDNLKNLFYISMPYNKDLILQFLNSNEKNIDVTPVSTTEFLKKEKESSLTKEKYDKISKDLQGRLNKLYGSRYKLSDLDIFSDFSSENLGNLLKALNINSDTNNETSLSSDEIKFFMDSVILTGDFVADFFKILFNGELSFPDEQGLQKLQKEEIYSFDLLYSNVDLNDDNISRLKLLVEYLNKESIKRIDISNNSLALRIFLNPAFMNKMKYIDIVMQYKIAVQLSRLLDIQTDKLLTDKVLNKILPMLMNFLDMVLDFADKQVILDEKTGILGIYTKEKVGDSDINPSYLESFLQRFNIVIPKENKIYFEMKDGDKKQDFLNGVKYSKVYLEQNNLDRIFINVEAHGISNGTILLGDNIYFTPKELAEALKYAFDSGVDLEKEIVLNLGNCFGGRVFKETLIKELKEMGVYNLPQIITAAGVENFYAMTSDDSGENNFYLSVGKIQPKEEGVLTIGDVARARPVLSNHTTTFESRNELLKQEYETLREQILEILSQEGIAVVENEESINGIVINIKEEEKKDDNVSEEQNLSVDNKIVPDSNKNINLVQFDVSDMEESNSALSTIPNNTPSTTFRLTMTWLSKLLDRLKITDFDKRQKIINIIENPIIALGIFFPTIRRIFVRMHGKEEEQKMAERGINYVLSHTNVFVKEAVRDAVGMNFIKKIIEFAKLLARKYTREDMAKAHTDYNRGLADNKQEEHSKFDEYNLKNKETLIALLNNADKYNNEEKTEIVKAAIDFINSSTNKKNIKEMLDLLINNSISSFVEYFYNEQKKLIFEEIRLFIIADSTFSKEEKLDFLDTVSRCVNDFGADQRLNDYIIDECIKNENEIKTVSIIKNVLSNIESFSESKRNEFLKFLLEKNILKNDTDNNFISRVMFGSSYFSSEYTEDIFGFAIGYVE
ncbi:MAG: C13 family peptidase, partial [Endomicrobiaceae bacterium]|nr:C13 family peptidase [Endomicrobiaceae bacterium]